jgi:MSHA biogenesis protein MshQ
MCINPTSAFTYMGEEFQISAMIEAQNAAGVRTRNYVGDVVSADDYAKLDVSDLGASSFFIFEELVGVDTDLSSRRVLGSTVPDVTWPDDVAAEPSRGIGMLSGNLIFDRQADGSEDGPFTDLSIGLETSDSDGATLELGIDIDEVMPLANDVALISTESFRYGRLMIDNTFGPETEELAIPFRIEYYNGSDWATNILDNCTVLSYNATEDDATLRSTFYVDGSWEGALDGDSDNQDDGETTIENVAVVADNDVAISISGGLTGEASGIDLDADDQDDDRPLVTSAPGEGFEGSVQIEFDLNHGTLPYSLDFLSYDWRSTVEIDVLDPIEDGNYVNNPRSQVNFGTYRGHDRVINWQEIYIGPTP